MHSNIKLKEYFSCKNDCTRSIKRNIRLLENLRTYYFSWTRRKREQRNGNAIKQNSVPLNAKPCTKFTLLSDDAFLQVDTSSHLFLHIRRRNALLYDYHFKAVMEDPLRCFINSTAISSPNGMWEKYSMSNLSFSVLPETDKRNLWTVSSVIWS